MITPDPRNSGGRVDRRAILRGLTDNQIEESMTTLLKAVRRARGNALKVTRRDIRLLACEILRRHPLEQWEELR